MSKRVILHIGMHKTGTTSLQQTFGNSRDILLDNNIYYPSIKPYNHSANFPPVVMEDISDFQIFRQRGIYETYEIEKEVTRLKELWIKEFINNKCDNFIISGEELSKLKEQDIINMKKLLKEYFEEVKIIIYVREPSSFIPSVLSEFVKHGGRKIINEKFTQRFPFYISRIQSYVKVFGIENVIVKSFNRACMKNQDLYEDFFNSLNIDFDTNLLNKTNTNESLSNNTVSFLLEYNKRFPRFVDGKINTERGLPYRLDVFYNIIKKIKGDKFTLNINYGVNDAKDLNNEIEYVNKFLSSEQKFNKIQSSNKNTVISNLEEIPMDYFLELINEYNIRIDKLIDDNEFLREKLRKKKLKS